MAAKDDLPPVQNLRKKLVGLEFKSYTIGSWCPTPDGSEPPTAVALEMEVEGLPPIIMRLKSKRAVDEMIAALERHKQEVWPDAGRN